MKKNISFAQIPSDIQERIDNLLRCIHTPSPSFADPCLLLTMEERIDRTRRMFVEICVYAHKNGRFEEVIEKLNKVINP